MDLKGMLNDGAAPEKKSSQGSPLPTPTGRISSSQSGLNGAPPSAGAYTPGPAASQQSTPFYPPSGSVGPPSNPQSRGLTPLQTPGHGASSGQYPFPQQTAQSPATGPAPQPYRAYESYPATTPSARPTSYGYPITNPSPSHYNQSLHNQTTSQSPTPSSHHSQTPHSVRQSPLSHMIQPPHPQAPLHQYQHSQPSTPLGPPQHIPRHGTNQFDASSPFHQRTFSSTSGGAMPSPAQHQTSIGSLVQSPSAHHRPSPQRRSGSDYHSQTERERSLSVSPKTMVPPRPPSLGSRHSSQNDVHSSRSSMQPSASVGVAPHPETPSHVQPPTPNYAQTQYSYLAGNVAQVHTQASGQISGNPTIDSLSGSNNQIPLQHSPQKMGMHHLLAPTQHGAHMQNGINGGSTHHNMPPQPQSEQKELNSHAQPGVPSHVAPSQEPQPKLERNPNSERAALAIPPQNHDTPAQYLPPVQHHSNGTAPYNMEQKAPLKRTADSQPSTEPPPKRERRSRYTERPVWANLDPRNPRARQPGVVPNGPASRPVKAHAQGAMNGPPPARQPPAQPQGTHTNGDRPGLDLPPWQQNPPLDNNLIRSRRLLGPWERSMLWQTNMPSIVKSVTDWLVGNLQNLRDVGFDPREGSIEIEGKIGTLLTQNGSRCDLPVTSMVVLDPSASYTRNLRFESQMQDAEHKDMNSYLNSATQTSFREPGREKIDYKHLFETDSFRTLSEVGLRALPEAIHKHNQRGRDLKLRTTIDSKTKVLKARIVKVKVADLHIFNPGPNYDMRISINIECNLIRPDLDPHALTKEPNPQEPVQPDRKKDRLSYKQLKYSVDLTRVDVAGMPPKYELEIEVDANALRQEMSKMLVGQDNGFTDIVDGFMENAQWLMKQVKPGI